MQRKALLMAALILIFFTYLLLALHDLVPPPPPLNRYSLLAVQTGSMAPALPVQSVIAVEKTKDTIFQPGEIITFRAHDNRLITHRIIDICFDDETRYVTKGDANRNPDPYFVLPAEIYGRVVYVTPPHIAKLILFLRSGPAITILTVLFLFMLTGVLRPLLNNYP